MKLFKSKMFLFAVFITALSIQSCSLFEEDLCEGVVCQNNGTCMDGDCDCLDGFSGTNCETEDLCVTQNVSCQNGGTCNNGTCDCPDGFSGTNCEVEDLCITQPIDCQNGGTCDAGICDCPPGASGANCETLEPINAQIGLVVLANDAGPEDKGGIDLYSGTSVPIADASADIIDAGLGEDGEWLFQIQAVNGAAIRTLSEQQLILFFEIEHKLEIVNAWNEGIDTEGGVEVTLGDIYLIKKDNDYFIIECATTHDSFNPGDQDDFVAFDIKQAIF